MDQKEIISQTKINQSNILNYNENFIEFAKELVLVTETLIYINHNPVMDNHHFIFNNIQKHLRSFIKEYTKYTGNRHIEEIKSEIMDNNDKSILGNTECFEKQEQLYQIDKFPYVLQEIIEILETKPSLYPKEIRDEINKNFEEKLIKVNNYLADFLVNENLTMYSLKEVTNLFDKLIKFKSEYSYYFANKFESLKPEINEFVLYIQDLYRIQHIKLIEKLEELGNIEENFLVNKELQHQTNAEITITGQLDELDSNDNC